jgi:hypothetical protein
MPGVRISAVGNNSILVYAGPREQSGILQQIQSATAADNAPQEGSMEQKLDRILQRMDKIEKRLDRIERGGRSRGLAPGEEDRSFQLLFQEPLV